MSKLDWLTQEIDGLKEQGLYNRIRTIGSAQGAWITVDGKNVLNFCSNNYLGLANHPKVVEAAKEATRKYGVGPAAVRSIAGTTDLHVQLEQRLAKFKGAEDVITFQSPPISGPLCTGSKEDVIFSDGSIASIIDGCRLSAEDRCVGNDANAGGCDQGIPTARR
jgi:glycine C-acetyltransferase